MAWGAAMAENWSDNETTVGQLRAAWERFVDDRDWRQFHWPKNLAMAVAAESGELLEPFLWTSGEESRAILDQPQQREAIEDEVADVAGALLAFCNASGIDLSRAIGRKMAKNALKYPVESFKGRYRL